MKFAIFVVISCLLALAAYCDTILKDEGVTIGPVTILNFVGPRVTATRDAGVAIITVP